MNINIVKGDLLKSNVSVIGHQCNCFGVVGGLATLVFNTYPVALEAYSSKCNSSNKASLLGKTLLVKVPASSGSKATYIANLFGQFNAGRDTRYKALESALEDVKQKMYKENLTTLGLPYNIGCGIGGGDWETVLKIIHNVFDDSQINVNIYSL
ncbi:MAG: macro domain-containing protein [Bacteroidales bacterium]